MLFRVFKELLGMGNYARFLHVHDFPISCQVEMSFNTGLPSAFFGL